MIKKLLLGTGLAVVVSSLVLGRDVCSYVKTTASSAHKAIKSEIPIEFEIQRARDLVNNLLPDIRQCMHVIAEEEVNVDHLNRDIAQYETDLNRQRGEILALRNDLSRESSTYRYAGHVYTQHDVKRDLSQRFERFKTAEATLASKRQILGAREKSVAAAREKLTNMISSKRDLEVQIENLEARMKIIEAAQTASRVQLDDSQLSRAKQLIRELNKQLDVSQKVLDAEGNFSGLIPVEPAAQVPDDLASQIDDYFAPPAPNKGDRVAEAPSL